MISAAGMLAALCSLVAAALVVLSLPWWASLTIALALPLVLALGGAALLGQVALGAGLLAAVLLWIARRRRRHVRPLVDDDAEHLNSTAAQPKVTRPVEAKRAA